MLNKGNDMLAKAQVYKALENHLGQTHQKEFLPILYSLLNDFFNNGFHVNRVESQPKELDEHYIILEIGAAFTDKTVIMGTSFAEFYLSELDGSHLFLASGYRDAAKASKLLNSYLLDYFAGYKYFRSIMKQGGTLETSEHKTLMDALSSHLSLFSFSAQSLDDCIILNKEPRIFINYHPSQPYKQEKIVIRAELLN